MCLYLNYFPYQTWLWVPKLPPRKLPPGPISPPQVAGLLKKKKEKTHDNDRVDDAVAEQAAVGGDGVETLQQQYQRFDQHQVI